MESPNNIPFMYQDLMGPNAGMMPPMVNPFMAGMAYPQTNMLGGMRLNAQPDEDKFTRMQERDKDEKRTFLKALAALVVVGGSAALLFRGKMDIKGFFDAIAKPFKWIGSKAKAGGKAVVTGAKYAAGKTKQGAKSAGGGVSKFFKWCAGGFKKAGSAIATPFKAIGRGAKKAGSAIAAPFKAIERGVKRLGGSITGGVKACGRGIKKAGSAIASPFKRLAAKFKKSP